MRSEGELGKMFVDLFMLCFILSKQLYPSMKQQPLRLAEKQGNSPCHRNNHGSKFQLLLLFYTRKQYIMGPTHATL